MKKGKVIIVCLILLIAAVFAFEGCGSKPVLKTEAETTTKSAITPVSSGSGITKIEIKKEEPKKEVKKEAAKVISGDIGSYLDVIDSSVISEIADATDEKYSYIGDASNGMGVIEATKDELNQMYKEEASEVIKKQGNGFQVETIDQMEKDAIAVLKAISSNNELDGNISITYSGNNSFVSTAFGDHIGKSSNTKTAASTGKYDTRGHFEEAGLSLEMTNFEVEKVIGGESSARLGIITIVVSADTKCLKNDGAYTGLSWIPAEGESRNIKYAVQFWADCYNGTLHEVVMEDLSIVE